MQPSRPGYNFSTADLEAYGISPREAARILVQATGGEPGSLQAEPGDLIVALLAQLAKSQRRANAVFAPIPFSLATYTRQQMLSSNPRRSWLMIQNVGSNDLMVAFETAQLTPENLSGNTSELTNQQQRSLRIVAGGYFEPLVAPSNAITLFTLNGATNGVIVEGA